MSSSSEQLEVGAQPKAVPTGHIVQFYETDDFLCESVSRFLAEALDAGESILVIATDEHRQEIERRLGAAGLDVLRAKQHDRLIGLDARATLAALCPDGLIDEKRFSRFAAPLVERAAAASPTGRVRAFGEMVDLLWRAGHTQTAIHLEELWNELLGARSITLLCAYVLGDGDKETEIHGLCASHAQVLPSEPGTRQVEQREKHARALRAALRDVRVAEQRARALEEAARRGEKKLQLITDALPALVSYVDINHRYTFMNRSYQRWYGEAPDTLIGRHMRDALGEAGYEQVQPFVERALRGETVTFQTRLPHARGERFIEATYVPQRLGDGRGPIDGFVALVHDISDRKRLEEERSASVRRTERLLSITAGIADAVTTDQVYAAIVDQTAAATGASTAALWLLDDGGASVSLMRAAGHNAGALERFRRVPLSGGRLPVLDVVTSGQSLWIDSTAALIERYPELANAITRGDYSLACLPIHAGGHTAGVLAFTFESGSPRSHDERGFLQLVARYCGQALERLQLLTSERASRAAAEAAATRKGWLSRASQELAAAASAGSDVTTLLRSIASSAIEGYADGCAVVRVEGDALEVVALAHRHAAAAAHAARLLGGLPQRWLCPESVLVQDALDLLVAQTPFAEWVERYQPTSMVAAPLPTRDGVIGMIVVVRGDGHQRFTDDDRRLLDAIAQQSARAIEALQLYEENRAARQRVEEEHERTVRLHALAGRVISASSIGEVYDAVLDTLERALGADRGAVLVYDHDGVMRFRAWRGLSDAYRDAVEGHSPWPRDAKDPQPVFVGDAKASPDLAAYRELFEREEIGALGFFPLVADGKLVGKFMLYYNAPRPLQQRDLDTGMAIANHVAMAVSRFSAQAERERLIAELEQTVRFHEMFTGMLGHDLRNPLAAIMTAGQLALKKRDSDKLLKPLQRIVSSGDRMARMIDQLLDFTRVRLGGGIPLEPEQIDLVPLMRQVLDELVDTHAEWSIDLSHCGDCRGVWDRDRLGQVFSNLVGNAVRHGIAEHGVRVRIDGDDPGALHIEVHNRGAVPSQLVEKIFDPMTGGDRRRDKSQGLGLGLYITRQIVKAHGGDVTLRTSEAEGTTFRVTLPRAANPGREELR